MEHTEIIDPISVLAMIVAMLNDPEPGIITYYGNSSGGELHKKVE